MGDFGGILRWTPDGEALRRDERRLEAAFPTERRSGAAARQRVIRQGRLAFAPVEAGHAEEGAVQVREIVSLFDGRIDDRAHLLRRLHAPQQTDGPLARAAFLRWGTEAPEEMIGEFAWAVWLEAEGRLMLARDISVSRTLYWRRSRETVAFSTSLRALLALGDAAPEIDDEALADFLVINPEIGDRTLYKGVRRVCPGRTWHLTQEGERSLSAWTPRPAASPPRSVDACVEAARELFAKAVADRLPPAGGAAVSLSGGLDSSAIAAQVARTTPNAPVRAYVSAPPTDLDIPLRAQERRDDRVNLDALARLYPNLDIRIVEPGHDGLDSDPSDLFMKTGTPVWIGGEFTWHLAGWRAAAAEGVKLMLMGGMGEASLNYHGELRTLARSGPLGAVSAVLQARGLARWRGGSVVGVLDQAFLGGSIARLMRRSPPILRPGEWAAYSAVRPDLIERTGAERRLKQAGFPGGAVIDTYGGLLRRTLRWNAQPNEAMAALGRMSGLEATDPFADRRVLQFCLSLPERLFVREGRTRWLGRAVFGDILPRSITDEPRKAAQNPEWFHRVNPRRNDLTRQLELISSSPLARRALDLDRLRCLIEQFPEDAADAHESQREYRFMLGRGLHAGAFLRWFDRANDPQS